MKDSIDDQGKDLKPDSSSEQTGFGRPVAFGERRHGYDKEQVDRYLRELAVEYNAMHEKYMEMEQENESLKKVSEVISSAILDAEVLAKQIIKEASAKARVEINPETGAEVNPEIRAEVDSEVRNESNVEDGSEIDTEATCNSGEKRIEEDFFLIDDYDFLEKGWEE